MAGKIKLGIIGVGSIAQLMHLPILKKLKEVDIVALADTNKIVSKSVSKKFNIEKVFTDYTLMLKEVELDAVLIATPTNTHKAIALDCIEAGIPVLIEKPISTSKEEAELIAAKSAEKNVMVMVGMNMRYRPDLLLLKSIISNGDIGKPIFIKCGWMRERSSASKWFLSKNNAGGGVIFDLGIVMLDLALWIMDFPKISSVSTQNFNLATNDVEDSSVSMVRTAEDTIISIETSWEIKSEKDSFTIEVVGTKGTCLINPLRVARKIEGQLVTFSPINASQQGKNLFQKSYENELKHFLGAVKGNYTVHSPAKEAVSRMNVIEKMYQSAKEKMEIRL